MSLNRWLLTNWDYIQQWMQDNLFIRAEGGEIVPFKPNWAQKRLYGYMRLQLEAGYPAQVIVLKARKLGISTAVACLYYAICHLFPNNEAYLISADTDLTHVLLEMVERADFYLHDDERKKKDRSNRLELAWEAPHSSKIILRTAGAKVGARGPTPNLIHVSELAAASQAKEALAGALNAMPKSTTQRIAVIESTANGAAGEFYDRWQQAEKRTMKGGRAALSSFFALFFSWLEEPRYSAPVPARYEWGTLSKQEVELRGLGATDEQLYWRRQTLANECGGDEDLFMQEYPATPREAFLTAGRPAIPGVVLRYHRELAAQSEPLYALLQWNDLAPNGVMPYYLDEPQPGCWKIYHSATDGEQYSIGVDVAEGILSDPGDAKSPTDRSAVVVLNRNRLRTDATYVCRIETEPFGEEALKGALYFNRGLLVPDTTGLGIAVLNTFERHNYANIFQREEKSDKVNPTFSERYGYRFTTLTRRLLVHELRKLMLPDWKNMGSGQWMERLQVLCKDIIEEEEGMVMDERGNVDHQRGGFSDLFMALGLAVIGHIQTPISHEGYVMSASAARDNAAYVGGTVDMDSYLSKPKHQPNFARRRR